MIFGSIKIALDLHLGWEKDGFLNFWRVLLLF